MFWPKTEDLTETEKIDSIYRMLRAQKIRKLWSMVFSIFKWVLILWICGYVFVSLRNDHDGTWSDSITHKAETLLSPLIEGVVQKVMPIVLNSAMSSAGGDLNIDFTQLSSASSGVTTSGTSLPNRRKNVSQMQKLNTLKQDLIDRIRSTPDAQKDALRDTFSKNPLMKELLNDPEILAAFSSR